MNYRAQAILACPPVTPADIPARSRPPVLGMVVEDVFLISLNQH
jgi:hypothetical protein